jgi:hypothetical protein
VTSATRPPIHVPVMCGLLALAADAIGGCSVNLPAERHVIRLCSPPSPG